MAESYDFMDEMDCPTPCVCGRIVELGEMLSVAVNIPNGGNLVCEDCHCEECNGEGDCQHCDGGDCMHCGASCSRCDGSGDCQNCMGKGWKIQQEKTR